MCGDTITIDYLKHHEAAIPRLAEFSYLEWRPIYDRAQMTLDDVVRSYAQRVNIDVLPLALVALYQERIIGAGSLKLQDLDARPQFTPWLGGLFVVPEHRGRGVGTALVNRLIAEACRLGILRLYLWTPSAAGLYTKLGWLTLEKMDYCGHEISIMRRELRLPFSQGPASVQNWDNPSDERS
jgi:GNAT superfamily N-acetyltransferase